MQLKNKTIYKIVNLVCLLGLYVNAFTQESKTQLGTWSEFRPEREKELYLRFESNSFFDNYEYDSPHVKGQTLIGAWGRLISEYYLTDKLRVQAGINGLKYSGRNNFSELSEWFSVVYKPNNLFSFALGSFDLYTEITLPEQMYSSIISNTNPNAQGALLKFKYRWLNFSTFLNWEKFIVQGDDFQEVFTAGARANLNLSDSLNNLKFEIPLLLVGRHHGGEINSSSERIESLLNMSLGLNMCLVKNNFKYSLKNNLFLYNDVTHNHRQPIDNGFGFLSEAKFSVGCFNTKISYWHSNNFYAPLGHKIYLNYTLDVPNMVFTTHNLLSGYGNYVIRIADVANLIFECEYWYDINRNKNNLFTGIKLIICDDFFIYKVKNKKQTIHP